MLKSLIMVTGVPGSGKTTVVDVLMGHFHEERRSIAVLQEYQHILSWARMEEHARWIDFPPGGGFDIKLSGYRPMSDFVGRRLANDIEWSFFQGEDAVVFETARGVGEPFVTYGEFVNTIVGSMSRSREGLRLVNIEVLASVEEIERRMIERFLAEPETAPPPGIEKKYLSEDGRPLCFATEDLARSRLGIPLVMNEALTNGIPKEEFEARVRDEVYPRIETTLGMIPFSPEGGLRTPERP